MDNSAVSSNKRIAKNTLMLYLRMFLTMIVGFYTSRVVLNTLGVEDYGIYGVVGGVVAMFGFLNAAMTTSTQRFLSFELGRNNFQRLQDVFVTSIQIHFVISFSIIVLAETLGLWFLLNKIVIPNMRMNAALWVFHLSVCSMGFSIMSFPFNASIIAHEKMGTFAYISILETSLKLVVVFLLVIGNIDKLILYAVLLLIVQVLITSIYATYAYTHFDEVRFKRIWKKQLIKTMGSFAGWNLFGNLAAILFSQGLNLLLNVFFGPAVNAARAVVVTVNGIITQFSSNFQAALNPQITKTYAQGDLKSMHSLIFRSSKFTFFLLLMIALPVFLEALPILTLWLKIVPEYSEIFMKLIICISIIDAVANPLMNSAAATGKVKIYQSMVGSILLTIVPISYIVLKMGGNPQSVFVVQLCIASIAFVVRLFIIRPLISFSIRMYIKEVLLKCFFVVIFSLVVPLFLKYVFPESLVYEIIIGLVSFFSVGIFSYFLGLSPIEQEFVKGKILKLIKK